jgi:hypothetical protein
MPKRSRWSRPITSCDDTFSRPVRSAAALSQSKVAETFGTERALRRAGLRMLQQDGLAGAEYKSPRAGVQVFRARSYTGSAPLGSYSKRWRCTQPSCVSTNPTWLAYMSSVRCWCSSNICEAQLSRCSRA